MSNILNSQPDVAPNANPPSAPVGATASPPAATASLPPIYYDPAVTKYFITEDMKRWVMVNESGAFRKLVSHGYSPIRPKTGGNSIAETMLLMIQQRHDVAYVGSLAGHRIGHQKLEGNSVLITDEAQLIKPVPGDCSMVRSIFENMLGEEQLPYFYGWLKSAYEMFESGLWAHGQCCVLAGPPNSGKSLSKDIIAALFGNRVGRPLLNMTQGTRFNDDIMKAEILVIDDEISSSRYNARQQVAAAIKQVTATHSPRLEKKYGNPIVLPVRQRMVICLNDDAESLQVLPPLTDGLADKLMLFRATRHPTPEPASSPKEKALFWEHIMQQLPAFADFIKTWSIPKELVCDRFGIAYYHHPDIVENLEGPAPERELLEMIDCVVFDSHSDKPRTKAWSGTAANLMHILKGDGSAFQEEAKHLIRGSMICGRLLGRLRGDNRARFATCKRRGDTYWTIQPPSYQDENLPIPGRKPKPSARLVNDVVNAARAAKK